MKKIFILEGLMEIFLNSKWQMKTTLTTQNGLRFFIKKFLEDLSVIEKFNFK
jgi:hypothetical protein